ncbi:hypothetical protein CEUSTIGMA_g12551.t1 [Chlamydomonas eustigma]|uniref:HD domain-containing protein n=1 Tax=Chlamydomonas eustigma TaxID=1157962 RepID=A0A250XPX4_9CHLO|nr:hypothetical protein CEUSTIGMA_g12551.t1 [Chlamydomonas eustigma]|eukprot:GAX85131.1 hypothetical protein CEUSTIGMA_g12551.t1 [Chlamydomonas eustigma]
MNLVIQAAEDFVRSSLSAHDASHDFWHIHRVRCMARHIAASEGCSSEKIELVELAALLHDVADWKYAGKRDLRQADIVKEFLLSQKVENAVIRNVLDVISVIGFKDELPSQDAAATSSSCMSIEAMVVQDADRLDAIGAIGIARCFTFGGAFHRILHDPATPPRLELTKELYMKGAGSTENTTINHFYEKLLTLKDRMKTKTGKDMAVKRHEFMENYLRQFHAEWDANV